jgi:hypothetical protein
MKISHVVLAVMATWMLLLQQPPLQGTAAPAASPDAWSTKVTLRTPDGGYVSAVHGALMPNGNILFYGIAGPTQDFSQASTVKPFAFVYTPTPYWQALGSTLTVTPIAEPLDGNNTVVGNYTVYDSLICSGGALTADGRYFSAGGTRDIYDNTSGQLVRITAPSYATVYDGTSWTRVPNDMVATGSTGEARRWYPTVTRLPDNRMLVTSGFDQLQPTASFNLSAEAYDPTTGQFTVVAPATPFEILNSDYTHIGVLPKKVGNSDLVMLGSPGVPVFMSLATNPASWRISTSDRPGSEAFNQARIANGGKYQFDAAPDYGASSVMLPIRVNDGDLGYSNGTMLVAGGAFNTPFIQRVDRYDPQTDTWLPTIDTGIQRHHPMTVDLPDGRVLIIGGHSSDPNVTHAEYIDPMNGFAFSLGSSDGGEIRGYHAVSLLLPDGRVMVEGGRDVTTSSSSEKPSFRFYYPYYMFVSGRPVITSAPQSFGFGSSFQVSVSTQKPAGAVLISLGAMTHSFDENQRAVQVAVSQVATSTSGGWTATLTSPSSAQIAPSGYYMLFVLDSRRVPSTATIVHLG